jgi:hypothetical protein
MHCNTRLSVSRENWRKKAIERSRIIANERKKLARRDVQITELVKINSDLSDAFAREKYKRAELEASFVSTKRALDPVSVRVLCVLLVVQAVVSFRSVPRILKLMSTLTFVPIGWIPDFTSAINWTLRLGLARLEAVAKWSEPWLAIVDFSIDVGVKKVLVVLRVPLTALAVRVSALTLADCECIGLRVAETWNGELVAKALSEVFAASGLPAAIIKDSGSDLAKGVRLWRMREKAMSVWVISDIGHVVSNSLKASFAKRKMFNAFVTAVRSSGAKFASRT